MFLKHYAQKTVQIKTHNDSTMFTKKSKEAIQANTELILKLKPRKSFSEKNISFIHKSKHRIFKKKDIANWFAMSDIICDNKVEFRPLVDVKATYQWKIMSVQYPTKMLHYFNRLCIAIKHDHHQPRKLEGHQEPISVRTRQFLEF